MGQIWLWRDQSMLCHYNERWKKHTRICPERLSCFILPAAPRLLFSVKAADDHRRGGGKNTVKPVAQYSSSPEYADEGQQDAKGHTVIHQRKENWPQQMGSKISDKSGCMHIRYNLSSRLSVSTSSASRGGVSISSWLFWTRFCALVGECAIISGTTFILTWKQISLDVPFCCCFVSFF